MDDFSGDGDESDADPDSGADEADDSSADKADKEQEAKANDPHHREYYLRQIPKTDVEKTTAGEVIQEGLYNSGLILKDKLEDFDAADEEWRRLMNSYPDNVYRLDIYYNQYLMNVRRDRQAEAERYRQLILSEFPDSKYAQAMADPNYIDKLRSMLARQEELYENAYSDYLADRNPQVHQAYETMARDYPLSPLMPKFMFLHALAYVTENKPEEFGTTLRELLERYPETDMTPMASSYLKGLAQGRKLHSGASNMRSMIWDIRLTNDSTLLDGEAADLDFTLAPEEPHYLVLLFSTSQISPNQLLFDVARHNFTTYMVRDFDLEVMNFGQLGLLLVKGFSNEAELNHYRSLLSQDRGVIIPEGVRPVQISKSNFEKLLQGGGSFDDYFRFIGEETVRETHESVLPPEEYPAASEMYTHEPNTETPEAPAEPATAKPTTAEPTQTSPAEPKAPQKPQSPSTPKTPSSPKTPKTPTPPKKPTSPPVYPDYPLGSEGDED